MFKGIQRNLENQNSAATEEIPSTSSKEGNGNDTQIKSEQVTIKEKDQIASEKLRYDNADSIYPGT
ncbi:hypothetical protein [Paenibacillus prosopidis]|uniref:Uncharacterized protein n=1 Tax=Paenibacillus prosopidis TaxID=630520 RepID=A0A368VP61_9BACL|nr:hypothetical protein [Paenibacillus prosopidis]RCW42367.1 hypothetical protein DFP97_11791 [Paenibacillus prosopidis]